MGSRGRSIRLRIYLLVAIPLVTMIGLLTYVVTTSIDNVINLDRAPNLINATSVPTANFVNYLQNERLAAVVYLFQPTGANLQAYQAAIAQTNAHQQAFVDAMNSPRTKSSATAGTLEGISGVLASLQQLPRLREGVEARLLAPGKPMTALDALGAYGQGIQAEPKLFLDEAASMTNATAASQALGLIATVSAREALSQEEALLSGMLAASKASQTDRAAFTELASTRQGDMVDAESIFNPSNLAIFNAALNGSSAMQQQLTQLEGAVASGVPIAALPLTQTEWEGLASNLLLDLFNGGLHDAQAQLTVDRQIASSARDRMYFTVGIALLGLLLTILVTTFVGRSIVRRLRGLETTALTLAENQLPDVVGRLRRGDDVDVAVEAPPLRVGGDEIGRVGQAFDLVRQTAIRSAVEEARLRRGLNDVFRSLARRSQSLLHRQLTLLDQMERRASDPEALDDLFRLDHLTTRMRRHAEGLVILAGAPPGRAWSSPVRMMDVMRGAIAEVEDYARVSVATRSQAALSGSAVADVIHLLAELIENATTLSPPYTSVRVSGDTVANGFAIEVEDRGLGMSEQRLNELNDRLANPPEFNPSDSEQLGLFVVSQLARRHGIRVTLKASPYGGTEAVVLVPRHLVVTEEAFRALPGEPAAAITGGIAATNGNHFAPAEINGDGSPFPASLPPFDGPQRPGTLAGTAQSDGPTISGGPRISGALRRAQGSVPDGIPRGGHHATRPGANGQPGAGNGHGSGFRPGAGEFEPAGNAFGTDSGAGWDLASAPEAEFTAADSTAEIGYDTTELPRRTRGLAGDGRSGAGAQPPPFGAAPAPYPASQSAPYPASQAAPFPGWQDQGAPPTPMTPVAAGGGAGNGSGITGKVSRPPWELTPDTGPLPVVPGTAEPVTPDGEGQADGDFKGLPRRVRQASIVPQLRGEPVTRQRPAPASAPGTGDAGQPSGPSPDEVRATMSSLQRGWQAGRSQRATAGEPPWDSEPATEGETDGA